MLAKYGLHAVQRSLHVRGYSRTRIALVTAAGASPALLTKVASLGNAAFDTALSLDPTLPRDMLIDDVPAVRGIDYFVQLVRAHRIKEVWVVDLFADHARIAQLLDAFRHDFVNIRLVPDLATHALPAPEISDYQGLPVLNLVASPEGGVRLLPKAIFDRVFALSALLALAPLMLAIALAVKCSSRGPACAHHVAGERVGRMSFHAFDAGRTHVGVRQPLREQRRCRRAATDVRETHDEYAERHRQ